MMSDVETGRPYKLVNIDRVVFVPYEDEKVLYPENQGLYLDKSEIIALESGIKSGEYASLTQAEMVAQAERGMEQPDKIKAQLLGSPEAIKMDAGRNYPNTLDGWATATKETLDKLNQTIGEDILNRPRSFNNEPPSVTFDSAPAPGMAPAPAMGYNR